MIKHFPLLLALACLVPLGITPGIAAELNRTTNLDDAIRAAPSETDLTTPRFATAIDDLPLMPGLSLIETNDVVFKTDSGRIAETDAVGPVDIDDVYNFYRRSLPQLGWKCISARLYRRDKDSLHIDAHADGKTTLVHFAIRPSGK